jgi:hypothetical protein
VKNQQMQQLILFILLLRILIFKGVTTQRLYKSFGVKVLMQSKSASFYPEPEHDITAIGAADTQNGT